MKLLIVVLAMCTVAYSKPQRGQVYSNLRDVPILKYVNEPSGLPDGQYQYSYETGNGISAQETGYLKNAGNPQTEAQVMQGSYSYTGPDGVVYTINYIADENGFRAEGAHIPVAPPIPPAIQKSLQFNAGQQTQQGNRGRFF